MDLHGTARESLVGLVTTSVFPVVHCCQFFLDRTPGMFSRPTGTGVTVGVSDLQTNPTFTYTLPAPTSHLRSMPGKKDAVLRS